jgi:peptidoglycan/xylan/chitin deacetylase (PgdA/CDA1 family)
MMHTSSRYILLSFDVEEFDMPVEYGFTINAEQQLAIGKTGLDAILPVLEEEKVSATLFTTANFALHYPNAIRSLAKKHEIASHTFYHSSFSNEHLLESRLKLEEISGQKISGLRMPRMRGVAIEEVKNAGYRYDSSINPTWIPGRYNHFNLPRTVYTDQGLTRLPASVSPYLRIPLFWLSFKNFPYPFFKALVKQTLQKDGYVCLYFHPWEFTDINGYGLPGYVRKHCGLPLLDRLQQLVKDFGREAEFITIKDYLQ